ncbi:MAG: CRISPR-associated CARF protein Csx1 [bacterium]
MNDKIIDNENNKGNKIGDKEIIFLIVPIGNYRAWAKVKYRLYSFNGIDNDIENEIESKTSMKIIQKTFNPDKTIFVLSDTLIDNIPFDLLKDLNKYDFEIIQKLIKEDIINNLLIPEEIKFDDDSFVISFGKGFFVNDKEPIKKITEIIGNSEDFYYFILFSLANLFFDSIIKSDKIQNIKQIQETNLKIIIDTTHGINYQTVLVYKAVLELLKIFAFYFKNVFLVVYNSDPYINPNVLQKLPDKRVLNINIIEFTKVIPFFNVFKSSNTKFLTKSAYYNENIDQNYLKEFTKIENVNKEFMDNIYSFAASFIFGCPLYAIYFIPDSKKLYDIILNVFNKYINSIDFILEENSLTENENFVKIFINKKLTFTLEFENFIKIYILSKLLDLFNISKKLEISIKDIKDFNKLTYKRYFPLEYNRNSEEIRNIEKNINNLQSSQELSNLNLSNWVLYNNLIKKYNPNSSNEIKKRNFFAHSGFEYNSVFIKKVSDIIYLKPNDNKIQEIKKYILIDNLPNISK